MICPHCDLLVEENRQLREALFGTSAWFPPAEFRLTYSEALILQALVAHEWGAGRWTLFEATRAGPRTEGEDVSLKVVDVRICTLRSKLKPSNVSIETVWGWGYRLTSASRQRLLNWNEAKAA